jgi:hypothetical protein
MPAEQPMQPLQVTEPMHSVEQMQAKRQSQRKRSSQRDPNHPLPIGPMANSYPEPAEISATQHAKATFGDGKERDDAVGQLAGALRAANRAHRAYLTELRQGDVEPAEDWSTWYAEYLLGLR